MVPPIDGGGRRPRSRAVAALEIVGWLVLAAMASWFYLILPLRHLADTGGDFRGYHNAALALLQGRSPYLDGAFSYPPLLAIVVLPLAALELETARLLWYAASTLALGGAFVLTLRHLVTRRGDAVPGTAADPLGAEASGARLGLVAVAVIWGLGGTVAENLVLGQVNPFLLLLLASAGVLVATRPTVAAVAIGVAAALKVWPGALLLVFALRRQWRELAAGAATAIVLIAVPGAIARSMVAGSMAVTEQSVPMGTAAPLNVSLPALALRLADPPRDATMPAPWIEGSAYRGWEPLSRRGWIAAPVAVAVLAAAAFLLGRARSGASGATALDLGVMTAAAILASPVSWYHYQLCQFFTMAVLLDRRLAAGRWRAAALLAAFTVALTRAQPWLFGRYVERWGWTAQAEASLWVATSVGPLLGAAWLALAAREASRFRSA